MVIVLVLGDSGLLHDASMACPYFKQMCPTGLGKANNFYIETKFHLYITNSILLSGIYDKRYGFGFRIYFFSFLKNTFLTPLLMVCMFLNLFDIQRCTCLFKGTFTVDSYVFFLS